MKLQPLLLFMMLASTLAACVLVTDENPPMGAGGPANPIARRVPERLNIRVAVDCLPTCALVGTDLGQTTRTILSAFRESGRFIVTPSDQVAGEIDIKLSVERQNDWLDARYCNRSFGLIPASWHDRVLMTSTFSRRQGGGMRRIEQAGEVGYRCHLFLSPWVAFAEGDGALDRTVADLTRRTIAQIAAPGSSR